MAKHIHIDTPGGLSGDMFVSSMLDAFPELIEPLKKDLGNAGILDHVSLVNSTQMVNGIQSNHIRFELNSNNPVPTKHYSHIKERLRSSSLSRPILDTTLGIFDLLAQAEATVHGVDIDKVHFHEVADWDSQADIVAAASLINHCGVESWTCSALPIGGGTVSTAHGHIPVPAPASAELLKGFTLHDDGELGERVTPTGAAILNYLVSDPTQCSRPTGTLATTGTGCGNKRFKTVPNIARILFFDSISANNGIAHKDPAFDSIRTNNGFAHEDPAFDSIRASNGIAHKDPAFDSIRASNGIAHKDPAIDTDEIVVIQFDIDDMTPEELAISCEHLRATHGVIDVQQQHAIGKKGRSVFAIQLMCQLSLQEDVVSACFNQTTTIGLRCTQTQRYILKRTHDTVKTNNHHVPVKTSQRPRGETTTKIESDALVSESTLRERRKLAHQVQSDEAQCNKVQNDKVECDKVQNEKVESDHASSVSVQDD